MNKKIKLLLSILTTFSLSTSLHGETDAFDIYDWMDTLKGEWTLSPADKQIGTESYKSKYLTSLVGTNKPGSRTIL